MSTITLLLNIYVISVAIILLINYGGSKNDNPLNDPEN